MNYLLDSSVLISYYDRNDSNHKKAIEDLSKLSVDSDFWITEHILDEVINIFLRRNYLKQIEDLWERIKNNNLKLFTPKNNKISNKLISKCLKRVVNQDNTKASYTDIYSMIIVEDELINDSTVISYDHHFKSSKS